MTLTVGNAQQRQWDDDNAALANLCRDLPPLRLRAQAVRARTMTLTALLAGSAAAELAQLQLDVTALTQIDTRCQVNLQTAQARLQHIRAAQIRQIEAVTRIALQALQPVIAACQADGLTVTACEARATAAEATYLAARTLKATYPNLGLTLTLINHPKGPTNKLSALELAKLNTKLQGRTVTAWVLGRLPGAATRAYRAGEQMYIPQTLSYFPYQPSSEIFHDWVWETKVGHGQTASAMNEMLSKIQAGGTLLDTPFVTTASGSKWVVTHPNVVLNIILDAAKTVLITFYKT
ncbi:hypothetical protein [Pseudomonas sp. FEN]|uniref:hypothetical protein n=1 Tax=Pseudomonas sp. FEN TaxID=2767468 RepID=UPI001749846F|nr:hypothetical protein [Pseudomonas sp. FEN]